MSVHNDHKTAATNSKHSSALNPSGRRVLFTYLSSFTSAHGFAQKEEWGGRVTATKLDQGDFQQVQVSFFCVFLAQVRQAEAFCFGEVAEDISSCIGGASASQVGPRRR